jgi:LPS export ABC transporter protein LptC
MFSACENDMKQIEALTQKAELVPTESSTNLNVIFSDSGAMEYRLKAQQMDHYVLGVKEPYSEFPKGVYIESYDKNNRVKSTMKADYAIRHETSKKMEARYKIEIVNENGERLNTEHLVWNEETHQIISDTYVEIRTSKEVIQGTGMVANEDFSEWEIQKVSGTIPIDEKEFKKD